MAGLEEIWKEVSGYKGKYFISDDGRIKSFQVCKEGRILAKNTNRLGYNVYTLSNNCKLKTHTTHRLVCMAFIPNISKKEFINHIDGNKQNNNISNLEWCTHSENMQHALKTGLKVPVKSFEHYNSRFDKKEILEIRKSELSESKLALIYKVSRGTIGKIKRFERYKNI